MVSVIPVTPHTVPAQDVYKFFSSNASTSSQKQAVKKLLSEHTFACINQSYYLQNREELDQFLAMFQPRARNGESTEQQRSRFDLQNAQLWEKLPHGTPHRS